MPGRFRKFRLQDKFFHHTTQLFAFVVLATLVGILVSLTIEAWPSLKEFGPAFLWTNIWSVPDDEYGALAAIYGTVVTSVLALLIAVPISFGIALFLTETCPAWLRRPLGTAIELLAGIPPLCTASGACFVFAPLFADHIQPPCRRCWAMCGDRRLVLRSAHRGGHSRCQHRAVADGDSLHRLGHARRVRDGAARAEGVGLRVGCTTWEVARHVVLPYTRVGVIGGIMLGLGRALGETMAVTFVIGNANRINGSLFAPAPRLHPRWPTSSVRRTPACTLPPCSSWVWCCSSSLCRAGDFALADQPQHGLRRL